MRWRVASRLRDHLDSTATAGSTQIFVTDNRRYEDAGSFVGWYLYFPTGTLSGSEVRVQGFSRGVGFSILPTLSAAPTTGTPFELHKRSVRWYNDALYSAESKGTGSDWISVTDKTTLLWVAGNFTYTLGGVVTMDLISEISVDYYTNVWTPFIGPLESRYPQWKINQGEVPMLIFDRNYVREPANGQALKLQGARRPFQMAVDSDPCEFFNDDWIVEQALHELNLDSTSAKDNEARLQKADRFRANVTQLASDFRFPPPNAVWVYDDTR